MQSGLKAVNPGEEFSCSLGVDPSVRIDYKPARKHYDESGLVAKYTTIAHTQEIVVKNTKPRDAVKLRVLEQIPLPTATDDNALLRRIGECTGLYSSNDALAISCMADVAAGWRVGMRLEAVDIKTSPTYMCVATIYAVMYDIYSAHL